MSHPPHAAALPYCRNCHCTLAMPRPAYCGHCGQETDLHPPSVREMFTEYLGHYIAFDGPLWRTLWALVFLPGHLTNAYFHGARRRYVLPLRVYLSASFLFFVGSALLPSPPEQVKSAKTVAPQSDERVTLIVRPGMTMDEAGRAAEAMASGASAAARTGLNTKLNRCKPGVMPACTLPQRWVARFIDKAESITREQWTARARALAPYGMLAMQPVFAALLTVMFAGTGRRYAEHFVFSLHSHSLWFVALLAATVLDAEGLLMLAVFGHGFVALQRVYGVSRGGALWRGLLLSLLYFALLAIVALSMAITIAVTA